MTQNTGLEILGFLQNIPLSEKKVSGTRSLLTEHLQSKGIIKKIIDTEVYGWKSKFNLIRNISPDKIRWSYKQAFDVRIKEMRSNIAKIQVEQVHEKFNICLQIGSSFKIHHIAKLKNKPKFSYHDNNLMALIKSSPKIQKLSSQINNSFQFEKEVYDHLNGIFTMTNFVRESFIQDFKVSEDKVHCIGFGANLPFYDFVKDYDGNTILFIAKDTFKDKGGEVLLNAFKRVKKARNDAKLKLVGQCLNLDLDGVEVIGFIDKTNKNGMKKMFDLYRGSSLFVMPSYVEAAGNVFLEAMSNKLPCIGADRGATREIIVDNNCGHVIEPGNIKQLSEKIIELLDNKSELKKLGENGYKAIEKVYNWEVVCSKIINIMEKFI